MTLLEHTDQRLSELEKVLRWCESKEKAFPKGAIYTRNEKSGLRYYNRDARTGNYSYLGRGSESEIIQLEQKLYCEKLQKAALDEYTKLLKVRKLLDNSTDWSTVFYDIPANKRHLIKPLEISKVKVNEKELEIWKRERTKYNDVTPNKTSKGEYVKSKSELIIADRLEKAGVPYHYEAGLGLAELKLGQFYEWHPDFKVLNVRTGKEYWWEHFGMLDKPDYYSTFNYKLMVYAMNDIFLGDNLIVTTETSTCFLNTEYVDNIIQHYLK